jgi:hypothetical protein
LVRTPSSSFPIGCPGWSWWGRTSGRVIIGMAPHKR